MAEHGGTNIKGGGHPADSKVPAEEEIRDAEGEMTPQHRGVPGTNDPGVPGSRTAMGEIQPVEAEADLAM